MDPRSKVWDSQTTQVSSLKIKYPGQPKKQPKKGYIEPSSIPALSFGAKKLPDGSWGCPSCWGQGKTSVLKESSSERLECPVLWCSFTISKEYLTSKEKTKKQRKQGKKTKKKRGY